MSRSRDESLFDPLIPEGEYRLVFNGAETVTNFNHPKLVLHFRVIDQGRAFGVPLKKYYNIERFVGKPGRNGRFKPRKGSDFIREYFTVFPSASITRLDRINMDLFKKVVLVGKVKTVKKNNRQKLLPEQLWYSVVEELVRASDD